MNKSKVQKIQYLLIKELLRKGTVELILPDGITLEIGITQDVKKGTVKAQDYCYVVANRENRSTMLDSYNMGLQFENKKDIIIYEGEVTDDDGQEFRILDVV